MEAADNERRRRLRTMQGIALALLAAMAGLFVAAESLRGQHPAWAYVAAFAEAAMVGALADWFAVVALFRHPMGLPIWHTAIVPQRKDDIARNLGEFVESHFVSTEAVLARVREFDPATRLAAWLGDPARSAPLATGLSMVLQQGLAQADDTRLREAVRGQLGAVLTSIDPMPLATRWGEALVEAQRHQRGLDWLLGRSAAWLESEEASPTLAELLGTVDHVLVRSMAGTIAPIVKSGCLKLVRAVQDDAQHPLRQRFDGLVAQALEHLRHDASWAEPVRGFQRSLVASEGFQQRVDQGWNELKAALLDDLGRPDPPPAGQGLGLNVASLVTGLGAVLQANPMARAWVNEALCQAAEPLVVNNRGKVAAYIQTQIDAWSKEEMSARIELAIGRDLQFIRINGTVVGGLAGLGLYALVQLAAGWR